MEIKKRGKNYLINISLVSLMTALITVSAQLTVPLPSGVPVTLQTLTVALCGYFLGTNLSLLSVTVYILLGIIGVPVFSGFTAGTAAIFGKTGGFIVGFLFLVLACGLASRLKPLFKILIGVVGLISCHTLGIIWFSKLMETPFFSSAAIVSLPFIIKDILCVTAAALLSERLGKIFHRNKTKE